MNITWDGNKAATNRKKHKGVSFEEAGIQLCVPMAAKSKTLTQSRQGAKTQGTAQQTEFKSFFGFPFASLRERIFEMIPLTSYVNRSTQQVNQNQHTDDTDLTDKGGFNPIWFNPAENPRMTSLWLESRP